jgi:hypothetical protein
LASVGEGPRPDFRFGSVCCATAHETAYELLRRALMCVEDGLCSLNIGSADELHNLSPEALRDTLSRLEKGSSAQGIVYAPQTHQVRAWIGREWAAVSQTPCKDEVEAELCGGKLAAEVPDVQPPKKPKRSTEKGEGRAKLIAALTKHHDYANGSCLNLKPIGNNQLARLAGVDQATASVFFKRKFKGHGKYKAACADARQLATALKLLNGEFSPHILYGAKPPGEGERGDE